MNGLEEQFGDDITFIWLNVDDSKSYDLRSEYKIVARTRYVLVDADGEQVEIWIGPLNENAVTESIEAFLAEQN